MRWVVNNQTRKGLGLLLSLSVKFLIGKYLAQTYHFLRLLAVCWPGAQSARDNHTLACNFANYSPIVIFLLTHSTLTLPFNLSLMACFAHVNVSQGSVATYARCGWIFLYPFNYKFTEKSSSEKHILIGSDLTKLRPCVCGATFLALPVCYLFNRRCNTLGNKAVKDSRL